MKLPTTSAPWSIDEASTPNGKSLSVVHLWTDEKGEVHIDEICELVMDYHGLVPHGNAALLSSAPALLAACYEARSQLRWHLTRGGTQVPVNDQDVINLLEDAIAAAEGRK